MNKRKETFAKIYKTIIPRTLAGRLKVWGLLLVLVPGLLLLVSFMLYEHAEEEEKVYVRLQHNAALEQASVTVWAKNKLIKIRTLANSRNARLLDKEALAFDLAAALKADDKIENLIYINREGKTEIDLRHAPGEDVSKQDYFTKALYGQYTMAELIKPPTGDQQEIIFCWPVYDVQNRFQGAVLGVVPLSTIDSIIGRFQFGQTGDTYLVNKSGERFTKSRVTDNDDNEWPAMIPSVMPVQQNPAVRKVVSGQSGVGTYHNHQGHLVIGAYQWIDELNWGIVEEVAESEVLGPMRAQLAKMLLVFLLVFLGAVPWTIYMAANIRRPVDRLLCGSQQLRQLRYEVCIDKSIIASAPKELKRLCTTFNQMATTISEHRTQLEEMIFERTCALQHAVAELQHEIAGRRQAEVSLQQSEEKYRTLFDKATDAIFLATVTEGGCPEQFAEVNEKACKLLGYTRDELLQMNAADIDSNFIMEQNVKTALNGGLYREIMFETTWRAKTGDKIAIEMNVHRITVNGQPVYLGIARDITLRRRMEEEMARLERLNLVGEMAASIGHEVRNPMTTVRGFLQMLGRKRENNQNIHFFNLMIEELDRANSILTEFLSLAKNKAVDLKPQNLNTIIQAIHPLIKADALIHSKDVLVELGQIPNIPVDEKEIRQLIVNLARNGLEAMSGGTKLTIRTYTEDNEVVLAVDDQGPGIPEDVFNKMGTPFFTTKENGTGLGLAVCYSIAGRNRATIIPRTGSAGTTFFVRFPMVAAPDIAAG